jgi:hypothetical protein
MQCVNCQFFNVPGSAVCGRCGTTLRFDQLNVSTTPPRAPRHGRWLRNLGLTWLNLGREAARSAREDASGAARPLLGDDAPPPDLFVRMIVPGWALRRVGAVAVGWLALAAWVALVVLSVLFLGWQIGGLFLGGAFAVHYISGLAAVRIAGYDRVYTFRLGAVIAVILLVTLYVPVPWLFQRFVAQPVAINRPVGSFHEGDVILYAPAVTGAGPGQWVVFQVTERFQITPDTRRQHAVAWVQSGQYMAQVVARPGDAVEWTGKELLVNGDLAIWQPTGHWAEAKPQKTTVSDGHYLVAPWVPDMVEYNHGGPVPLRAGGLDLKDPTLYVARDRVQGRVFFKLHPLSEMGRVR